MTFYIQLEQGMLACLPLARSSSVQRVLS